MGDRGSHHDGVGTHIHRATRLLRGMNASLGNQWATAVKLLDESLDDLVIRTIRLGTFTGVATQRRADEVGPRLGRRETVVNRSTVSHDDDVVLVLETCNGLGEAQAVGALPPGAVEGDDVGTGSATQRA